MDDDTMTFAPPTGARTLALVAVAALVILASAPLGQAYHLVDVEPDGDAEGRYAAVSVTGDAECGDDKNPDTCVAVSGTGEARCEGHACAATSGTDDADCEDGSPRCSAVSGTGEADGRLVGASGTDNASGLAAASGFGEAEGRYAAASGTDDAECRYRGELPASCVVASGTGDATAVCDWTCLAASGTGNATCEGWTVTCRAVSGTGDADGERGAVSGTGDARCNRYNGECTAISGTGDADGTLAGASLTGNASGWIAVSGTGCAKGHVSVDLCWLPEPLPAGP